MLRLLPGGLIPIPRPKPRRQRSSALGQQAFLHALTILERSDHLGRVIVLLVYLHKRVTTDAAFGYEIRQLCRTLIK